jgi:hypothetical protein
MPASASNRGSRLHPCDVGSEDPFPERIYPPASLIGLPSAAKPLDTAEGFTRPEIIVEIEVPPS